jgi:hypothetical protein
MFFSEQERTEREHKVIITCLGGFIPAVGYQRI